MGEEEFERQYEIAVQRGEERLNGEPRARKTSYDPASDRLVIDLQNGATFIVPFNLIKGLRGARPELLAEVELAPFGLGVYWGAWDQRFSITALIAGRFGNEAWMSKLAKEMGRKGGSAKSESKSVASRENGKKGGRPRAKRTAS